MKFPPPPPMTVVRSSSPSSSPFGGGLPSLPFGGGSHSPRPLRQEIRHLLPSRSGVNPPPLLSVVVRLPLHSGGRPAPPSGEVLGRVLGWVDRVLCARWFGGSVLCGWVAGRVWVVSVVEREVFDFCAKRMENQHTHTQKNEKKQEP